MPFNSIASKEVAQAEKSAQKAYEAHKKTSNLSLDTMISIIIAILALFIFFGTLVYYIEN